MNARRILSRLGIAVIEEVRGELWALCPSPKHGDRNPSWSMNSRTGRHSCLSCGFGGTLPRLAAELLGFEGEWDGGAQSVAEWLAGEAAAEPKRELPPRFDVESRVGASVPFRLPEGVIVEPPREWPDPPRRYVVEERGIPERQAERWGLGYAAGGRLRGRIAIVVRDGSGRAASYMARSFSGAAKKYLYPAKEERADHDVMFGEEHWPAQRADRRTILVAEGALKAMALERVSGLPVAALGGSRLRPLHSMKLATFGRVVYVRDGGEAGEEAWEDVRANLSRHSELSSVELPEGEDADSLAKRDEGELRARLAPHLRHW